MDSKRKLVLPAGAPVAFQGELGAFSQRACYQIFGRKISPLPCVSFEDVFRRVQRKETSSGVIPIENSLAGSIHQNFDLLVQHSLRAVAETSVRIEHHLIAHAGASLADIKQVFSHPVALSQCKAYLRRRSNFEVVPFYDTAGSVKHILAEGLRHAAAIASEDAARYYGMKILCRNIEDNRENYTRFLALARRGRFSGKGDKTTVVFGLRNVPGALFKALSVFALRDIDLTKIESRPIHGKPWEYLFYADIQGDLASPACANALRHLREMTLYFKVLGSYPSF